MDKKPLLFDFDGVIADTFHIGHRLAAKMCVLFTNEIDYRKKFNGNISDADAAIRNGVDHGDACDHLLDWMSEYVPAFNMHARPFEHMPELVKELSARYTISIVSSTHNELIAGFLQKHGLVDAVDGFYGVETDPHKDIKFKMIFEKHGVAAKDCLFVTDTLGDVNEASSVGLSSIGVTWGFQDRATLERGNPFAIVDSPDELKAMIEKYFTSAQ